MALLSQVVVLTLGITLIFLFSPKQGTQGIIIFIAYEGLVLGGGIATAAQNLTLMLAMLELQSYSTYVILAGQRDKKSVSQGILLYFLISSLATSCLVLGWSLMSLQGEGFSLSTNAQGGLPSFLIVGSLILKLGAFPLHQWVQLVYNELGLIPLLAVAIIPQIPFLLLAAGLIEIRTAGVYAISALTILVGSLASAIAIKTHGFLGISGVANLGFNLTALGLSSAGLLLFNLAYGVTFTALCVIISRGSVSNPSLASWRGIKSSETLLIPTGALLLASLGGVPPLLGFYAKGGLISEGVGEQLILPVLACLLVSLPGIVAYLRLALTGLSPT